VSGEKEGVRSRRGGMAQIMFAHGSKLIKKLKKKKKKKKKPRAGRVA
jgi:hypothetical protein